MAKYITYVDRITGLKKSYMCRVIENGVGSRHSGSFRFEETIKVSMDGTRGDFFTRDGKQVGNVFGDEAYLEEIESDQPVVYHR